MITIVVPESAAWLRSVQPHVGGPLHLVDLRRSPSWQVLHALKRAWVRGRVDRSMQASFMTRLLADELLSRFLPRGTRTVIAPSLAAERLFKVARKRGIETILVQDLPDFATLHSDLDEAAAHHPNTRWLTRYRAAPRWVERQQREAELADVVLVRSDFARRLRLASGRPTESVRAMPAWPVRKGAPRPGRLVLFAGLAAARNGIFEAVEATRRAGLTLLVRTGEGSEGVFLRAHPHVREATTVERENLAGVGVVLAPAWCETHPVEVERAAQFGVPIVATDRAACFVSRYEPVERGDIWGIVAALGRVLDPTLLAA